MSRTVAILGSLALALSLILSSGSRVDAAPLLTSTALSTSATCGKPNDQGLIVYLDVADASATPEAGGYSTALVVYAPDGTEVHRVELDDFPTIYPLGVGCALLGSAPNLDSFLIDPVSGTLHRLALPEDYGDSLFPLVGWQRTYREHRWAFVTDNPATHALLVDTQTGETSDLAALVRQLRGEDSDLVVFLAVALSPDESSFLLMTDHDTWLVPTADPTRARRLPNATPARASYSEDGKQLLYVSKTGDTTSDVAVENLDGTGRKVLAEGGQHASAYWVPGSNGQQL
jgi:hypothetical protein